MQLNLYVVTFPGGVRTETMQGGVNTQAPPPLGQTGNISFTNAISANGTYCMKAILSTKNACGVAQPDIVKTSADKTY